MPLGRNPSAHLRSTDCLSRSDDEACPRSRARFNLPFEMQGAVFKPTWARVVSVAALAMTLVTTDRLLATNYDVDGDGVVDFALEHNDYQLSIPGGIIVHSGAELIAQPGVVFLGSASTNGFSPAFDAGVTVPGSLIPRVENEGTVRHIPLEAYDLQATSGSIQETIWGAALQTRFFICFRKTSPKGTRYGWIELIGSGPLYAKSHAPHNIATVGLMPENSDSITTPAGTISAKRVGKTIELTWSGGRLEYAPTVNSAIWGTVDPSVAGIQIFTFDSASLYFRVR